MTEITQADEMTTIEQMLGLNPKRPNPWGHGFVCLHWPCQECRDKEKMADEIKRLRKKQGSHLK